MSLDAIKLVTGTEQDCAQRKADAVLAAKKTVADAERTGQAGLDTARADAENKVKAMMADAEADAAVQAQAVAAETERACAALKTAARQQLNAAAELIVRRVVNLT